MKWACAIFNFKTWHYFSVSRPLCFVFRLPLFRALFTSFRRCHTERSVPVLLPGVMMKGQAQVQITLHHHVCVHLCASVAALPSAYLPTLVGVHQYASLIWTLLHVSMICSRTEFYSSFGNMWSCWFKTCLFSMCLDLKPVKLFTKYQGGHQKFSFLYFSTNENWCFLGPEPTTCWGWRSLYEFI